VESAQAAARTKHTYLAAQYARIKGRRPARAQQGDRRGAHSILVIAYHLLQRDKRYDELGGDYFIERQNKDAYQRRLITQLHRMGYDVALTEKAAWTRIFTQSSSSQLELPVVKLANDLGVKVENRVGQPPISRNRC